MLSFIEIKKIIDSLSVAARCLYLTDLTLFTVLFLTHPVHPSSAVTELVP